MPNRQETSRLKAVLSQSEEGGGQEEGEGHEEGQRVQSRAFCEPSPGGPGSRSFPPRRSSASQPLQVPTKALGGDRVLPAKQVDEGSKGWMPEDNPRSAARGEPEEGEKIWQAGQLGRRAGQAEGEPLEQPEPKLKITGKASCECNLYRPKRSSGTKTELGAGGETTGCLDCFTSRRIWRDKSSHLSEQRGGQESSGAEASLDLQSPSRVRL